MGAVLCLKNDMAQLEGDSFRTNLPNDVLAHFVILSDQVMI